MKNTDIIEVKYNGNEVTALYKGSTLIYQKAVNNLIMAGKYAQPGTYTYRYNEHTEPGTIVTDDEGYFSVEVPEPLFCCAAMFGVTYWDVGYLEAITEFPDTSNVHDMGSIFDGCRYLTSVDLSGFDTSNVTTMIYMFYNCIALTSLDLSSFDTSNVTDMKEMFYGCGSLTSLTFGVFDVSNVTERSNMFRYCDALTDVTGTISGIHSFLDLQYSPLTNASAMVFINGLDEVDETKIIKFKSTTYDTLTEEQIALATSKGWSVASA